MKSNRPFFVAFLLGALFLTALPFLQKRFLKAPPPVLQLSAWSAGSVGSDGLKGKVTLLEAEVGACDETCVQRVKEFGAGTRHVADLGDAIVLVTLADEPTRASLTEVMKSASSSWRFGDPEAGVITQLQIGLAKFLEGDTTDFARSHAIVLIDQNNAVRGFWQNDVAGRGNSINAARLLAKHGPNP